MKPIMTHQRIPKDNSFSHFTSTKENKKEPSKPSKPIRAMEYMVDHKNSFDLNSILQSNDNSQDLAYVTLKNRPSKSFYPLKENNKSLSNSSTLTSFQRHSFNGDDKNQTAKMKRSSSATSQQFYVSNPVYNIKKMAMSYSRRLGRSHNDSVFNTSNSSRSFSSLTSREHTKTPLGDKLPDSNESPSAMEIFDVQMNQTLKVLGKDYETHKKQGDKNDFLPLFRIHHMDMNAIYTQRPKGSENRISVTSATVEKISKKDLMEPDFRKVGDFEPGNVSQQLRDPHRSSGKPLRKQKPSARNVLNDLIDKMKQKTQIILKPEPPSKTHKLVKSASAQKLPTTHIPKLYIRDPPSIQKVDLYSDRENNKEPFAPNLIYIDLKSDSTGPTVREIRPSERAISTRKAMSTVIRKSNLMDNDKENSGDDQEDSEHKQKVRLRHFDRLKQPNKRSKSDNNDHLATIEEERLVD